jgi:serine protease Do
VAGTKNSRRTCRGVLAALVVAAAALTSRAEDGPTGRPDVTRAASDPRADEALDQLQERIIAVSEAVKPSVVHIEAIVKIDDRRNQITGSGVIASEDGLILTNHHVVERAEKVTVTVPGHRTKYPARILGADKQTDLAVLRIEPEGKLPAARFGKTADVRVGQWVLAIGNPYGLDGTVSFGIVSGKGRNLEINDVLNDFIQTDAMIDLGSSGGPLVDLSGQVVGINSRGQGRGIGFTIPSDTVQDVMRQIEEGGIERGWIGITMQPLDRDLATYFGVPDATGAVVNSVTAHSPGAQAGLEPGDILTEFNGTPIEAEKDEDLGTFQRLVARVRPGQKVKLGLLRNGKSRTVEVTVGTQPKIEPALAESDSGFQAQEITENLYREQRLATRRGAYVSFVARGSPASEAGLAPGDVVERVEKAEIGDLGDFRSAMDAVSRKRAFLITAMRGNETKFLLVKRSATLKAEEPREGADKTARPAPPAPGAP